MKHKLFTIFLLLFVPYVLWHCIEEKAFSSIYFYIGMILSIIAHAKKSWINLTLLFLHMSIEWYALGRTSTFGLILIHIIPEVIFFAHEAKSHMKKYYFLIMFGVFFSLISLFAFGKTQQIEKDKIENAKPKTFGQAYIKQHKENHHKDHNHSNDSLFLITINFLSLGGLLGCSGSHIPYHIFKEKPDKI